EEEVDTLRKGRGCREVHPRRFLPLVERTRIFVPCPSSFVAGELRAIEIHRHSWTWTLQHAVPPLGRCAFCTRHAARYLLSRIDLLSSFRIDLDQIQLCRKSGSGR